MQQLKLTNKDLYQLLGSFWHDNAGCSLRFQCRGGSMAPFVRDENHVTLRQVDSHHTLKTGDIVTAADHANERIIVHRIVKAAPPRYLIKGDCNIQCDGWYHGEDIWAVVEQVEDQAGARHRPRWYPNLLIACASRCNVFAMGKYLLSTFRKGRKTFPDAGTKVTGA